MRRFLLPLALLTGSTPGLQAVDFSKDVYPVLRRACFECHGHEVQKAGLRVDESAHIAAVIEPGDPSASELLRRVRLPRSDKEAMPRRGERLSKTEIAALEQWIADGAVWPETLEEATHWSYVAPQLPTVPKAAAGNWARNEIDAFILRKLQSEGLNPSAPASTAVLVRRLHLALTGLPPAPEEVRRWEAKGSPLPQAQVEKLVDQLLASEEFGVHWARPWLDLARYADSHGFQRDDLREIWAFRDWVVNALNADMPFTQFTIEQVAGDLLPNATQDQIVATGFHRCTPTNVEAGTEPEESRINQVIDRVNTTGAVWLGTTLECAQCHDHKYDPISQQDYYELLAYFNNTEMEADRANPKTPGSIKFIGSALELDGDLPNPERDRLLAKKETVQGRIDDLNDRVDSRFDQWVEEMTTAVQQPVREHDLGLVEFVSTGGAGFEEQEDGSILLTGKVPDRDTYEILFQGDVDAITGFQLEALADDRLPGKGPGRGSPDRPNFVLNSFEVRHRAANANDDKGTPLRFTDADANFSQSNYDVAGAIDDDAKSAWAINPKFHESHQARFHLAKPHRLTPRSELVVRLVQNYGGGRNIGKLRIRALTGNLSAASLSPALVKILKQAPDQRSTKAVAQLREHFELEMPDMVVLKRELASVDKQLDAIEPPISEVMREMAEPRMTTIFDRGVYTNPGEKVKASTPAVLPALEGQPENRLGLARWLVSEENPLTARVTVNRWWAELFGHGIVGTVEDFGIKGEAPTHPELLDWLAVTFMEDGWSMKRVLRRIVTSAAFQQDSNIPAELLEKDDANRLYARGPRFRLSAEGIRDNALAIAGLLSTEKGGPSIRPPQPANLWKKVGGQNYKYEVSPGEKQYRRGIYVVLKRGAPYPSFVNFDASARLACVVRRSRSNTPLQALTLLNDPVYVEAAQAFAKRLVNSPGGVNERIRLAYRIALARSPEPGELAVLRQLHAEQSAASSSSEARPPSPADLPKGVTPAEFTAWYVIATAILNLDETITRG